MCGTVVRGRAAQAVSGCRPPSRGGGAVGSGVQDAGAHGGGRAQQVLASLAALRFDTAVIGCCGLTAADGLTAYDLDDEEVTALEAGGTVVGTVCPRAPGVIPPTSG